MLNPLTTDQSMDLCIRALMDELLRRDGLEPVHIFDTVVSVPYRMRILPENDRELEIGDSRAFRPEEPLWTPTYSIVLPHLHAPYPGTAQAYESMLTKVHFVAIRLPYRFLPAYGLAQMIEFTRLAYQKFASTNLESLWMLRNMMAIYRGKT